jgi:arabinofuranosyltransferase
MDARRLQLATLALASAVFTWLLAERGAQWWVFTLDDAYITLRYSMHWAEGLGPTWNPGGAPAEGYTTTLWMALLALAIRLGLDGLLFAKLAGIAFAFATLAVASRMAWQGSRQRTLAACVPWLLGCAYWPFSLHAVSGMETTCSAFVLTLFFWLSTQPAPKRDPALALTALLACLARPEAVLACGATLVLLLVRERLPLLRALVIYTVLPGALYFALRAWHFGLLFPLSFYVKATGRAPLAGLSDVLEFYAVFVLARPWWGALALLGAWREPRLVPALVGALAFSVFFIFPEHIMAFESRYMIPLFPLLSALAGIGAGKAADWLALRTRYALPVASAVLLLGAAIPTSALSNVEPWLDYGRGLQRAHVSLAHAMRESGLQGAQVAMLDVGAVGYYADWNTLDTFGLNDAHVALTHRQDVAYVFAQQPALVVLVSKVPQQFDALFPWEAPLYPEAMRQGYRYLCDYQFDTDYYLQLFARDEGRSREHALCRGQTPRRIGTQ